MTSTLQIPKNDVENPELSIVIPALNEELTIGPFIQWCKEGIQKAQITTEILIIDSSKDQTSSIALSHGARVLKSPQRGLGQAYLDAIPFIRGKYIIMGDCDLTYDFRSIEPFVKAFQKGFEYIMGSRFKGSIEKGAMPFLHQYFGTPLTTWILNKIYKSHFSDIHCGMRGITKEALIKIKLQSQGWEYASEMVLKSVHYELKTTEVPIHFYKDPIGRISHHKRLGWWSPWKAGWDNLKAMFIYGPFFFLTKPGYIFLFSGLLLMLPLLMGPFQLGPITFSIHWMLLGLSFAILGIQSLYMSYLSRLILDFRKIEIQKKYFFLNYNLSMKISFILFALGILFNIPMLRMYFNLGFKLGESLQAENYASVFGLFLLMTSFINFTYTLIFQAICVVRKEDL